MAALPSPRSGSCQIQGACWRRISRNCTPGPAGGYRRAGGAAGLARRRFHHRADDRRRWRRYHRLGAVHSKSMALAGAVYPAIARLGQPEDIAGLAVLLASRAGAFITGQMIVADGGVTIA